MRRTVLVVRLMGIAAIGVSLGGCATPSVAAPRAAVSDAPAAPHGDYGRLLPLRSYVRLDRVGDDAHHFVAWYRAVGPNVAVYEVPADGGEPREMSGAWGGVAARPEKVPAIPPEQAALAARVREAVLARAPGARDVVVAYRGRYRALELTEIIPLDAAGGGGDPGARLAATTRVVLAVRPGLDGLAQEAVVQQRTSVGRLCGTLGTLGTLGGSGGLLGAARAGAGGDCAEPVRWLDLEAAPGPYVLSMLAPLGEPPGAAISAADRATLVERLLGAARREGASLDALLGRQGSSLLPTDRRERVAARVALRAKGSAPEEPPLEVDLPLDLGAALGATGAANASARATVAARTLVVEAKLARAAGTAPATATDTATSPSSPANVAALTLTVRVTDERGGAVELRAPFGGPLLVDGERAATAGLTVVPDEDALRRGVADPRFGAELGAAAPAPAVEISVGATLSPWLRP